MAAQEVRRLAHFGFGHAGFFFLLLFFFEILFQRLAVSAAVAEFFFFVTSVKGGIVETSLLLLILIWLPGAHSREGCGYGKLKDHQKLCAGTARDYSTTFAAGCKDQSHFRLV